MVDGARVAVGSSPHKWGIRTIGLQIAVISGSSPHKWGIHAGIVFAVIIRRFIPTQVGNTSNSISLTSSFTVHPHTSGEYDCWRPSPLHDGGSSPHKWGIRQDTTPQALPVRFIPTQVGNTPLCWQGVSDLAVHPHTSGEYDLDGTGYYSPSGSSPHKWGIRLHHVRQICRERFIPTQVGNTAEFVVTY